METIPDELIKYIVPVAFLGSVVFLTYKTFSDLGIDIIINILNMKIQLLFLGGSLIFLSSIIRFYDACFRNILHRYKEESPTGKNMKKVAYTPLLIGMTCFLFGLIIAFPYTVK